MEREDIAICQTSPLTHFTSSPKIFHPNLPFDGEILENPEINSCRVQIVDDAILCVKSWHYDVGKISGNNYIFGVTMAFNVVFHT